MSMANPLARLLREPLVHFLVAGALLFAFYALVSPGREDGASDSQSIIIVTPEQVARLREEYRRVWLRPPSRQEMAGLVESHVREEVLYREALRLGLDRGDAIVRRRLNQKMAFLAGSGAELLEPSQAELETYVAQNAERFRVPGRISFRQVFLGERPADEQVEAALDALRRLPADADPVDVGSPTLLPRRVEAASESEVRNQFGPSFVESLPGIEPGAWQGPVRSGYGWHLVRVDSLVPGRLPELDEMREQALRAWRSDEAEVLRARQYDALRERYRVVVQEAAEP